MDSDLASFLAVTALVMAVPGPSVLFAVTHRLQGGPAAGVSAVLGLESGLAIHVAAACTGISAVVAASPALFTGLQYAGAGYLGLLGLRLLRVRPGHSPGVVRRDGLGRIYLAGVLVDLLNPKTALYFVALLPQFVDAQAGSVSGQALLLGGAAVGLALLFDGGYAVLAGRLGRRTMPTWAPLVGNRVSGCCFLGLAAIALA